MAKRRLGLITLYRFKHTHMILQNFGAYLKLMQPSHAPLKGVVLYKICSDGPKAELGVSVSSFA